MTMLGLICCDDFTSEEKSSLIRSNLNYFTMSNKDLLTDMAILMLAGYILHLIGGTKNE